ncbi:MAG: Elongation factor 4 [Parcubacteria group bacterium GW2011_GWA2_39_18]|nr:MAG: Elongation factor 4 [Parcubacteria group bacterium GW2011_GWA2_39_18]
MDQKNIRNFCIIAHINHGKSTLSDRFLELTHTIEMSKMKPQLLDQMELERERGITIKLAPVQMKFVYKNQDYILNLIDTPGHADFSYEVSRSLAAVEGAILLVDASKGVQAQTVAHFEQSQKENLVIIPAINKIDLVSSKIEEVEKEIKSLVGEDLSIFKISAKDSTGVESLLEEVIEKIPAPKGDPQKPLRALVFDSFYDPFLGVIAQVRIIDGKASTRTKLKFLRNGEKFEAKEVGIFKPQLSSCAQLQTGAIGYIATGLKEINLVRVGDTISEIESVVQPLPGYKEIQPVVFSSFYPEQDKDFEVLRDGLWKLKLNDAALRFEPEKSGTLGRGFRCGFLGLLHMEIVKERLKREFNIEPVITLPSVAYKIHMLNGEVLEISNLTHLSDNAQYSLIEEPWSDIEIITPLSYLGSLMELLSGRRAINLNNDFISGEKVVIRAQLPLSEMISDFYDRLKSLSSGFASLSYNIIGWKKGDLVRLDIFVAQEKVEAMSRIIPKQSAYYEGKEMVEKLKDLLPRVMFPQALQAVVGGKVLARETIPALKKDVTGYLYGGDITRKRKLWEKQKRGKKKMTARGHVEIPSDIFLKLFKKGD